MSVKGDRPGLPRHQAGEGVAWLEGSVGQGGEPQARGPQSTDLYRQASHIPTSPFLLISKTDIACTNE
eukprot:46562-Eustigmatos_ZCMA.PRE.3